MTAPTRNVSPEIKQPGSYSRGPPDALMANSVNGTPSWSGQDLIKDTTASRAWLLADDILEM
ncbi:hypothetical protein SAMD00023353_4600140 [Rosellinia necatrix]|uniref:Uncharacterized protein n=1 Tax=Rosellinia necatrix TaxID=77044 RepID=A0A1S8A9C2_ROSNE|nr:hypothetical protein SAMD00023353_4600140 [Rosellinia necatrix]